MNRIEEYKQEIFKMAEAIQDFYHIEKTASDKDRTTFWHDRVLSSLKSGLAGGLIGVPAGGAIGNAISPGKGRIIGRLAGGAIGTGTANGVRMKYLNDEMRGGKKLTKGDYAKTVASGATSTIPGAGLISLTNTPEAVIKHKKRLEKG